MKARNPPPPCKKPPIALIKTQPSNVSELASSAASPALGLLAEWVEGRSKEFEAVAQVRDADAPTADRALDIVRAFIIERRLILYGGQAIDFALRLKGAQIYPDHQTPDFDFFSPQSVDDAYDLADILRTAGFANVGAIPAIHVQTMRVKTDFIYVADISYTPRAVFDSLPTVAFAGMRILHPDYQRTDMHLAFCFPFNNPPREDVFHRFSKDLKRFRLLQEHYPITSGAGLNDAQITGGTTLTALEVDLAQVAVHGFAAYGVFRATLSFFIAASAAAKVSKKILTRARELAAGTPEIKVTFEAAGPRHRIHFEPPVDAARLLLATPWPNEVVKSLTEMRTGAKVEWYAPYMDSRPLMARVSGGGLPDVDVHSTQNRLLAVSVVEVPSTADFPIKVSIVSPQYLLLNFLYEAHVSEGGVRGLYVGYYGATLRLLEAADLLIGALRAEKGGPKVPESTYRAFVESSPFGLAVRPFGDVNRNASYLIRLAGSARAVGDTPPGIDLADLPDLAKVPPKYFPSGLHDDGSPSKRPSFDYETNAAFQRAGQPLLSLD
ncbi:BA71V-C475L protein [Elysia marginata]|uniref:BA71V-C475L protein n=1 Tax=Elysia marginata TaxID=1093978 RepID=A0AAV4GW64_9GAST|nr:BA71V-C475L protein [Elysia marginata]